MNASRVQSVILLLISLSLSGCSSYGQKPQKEAPTITVTTVQSKTVTLTHSYVCQLESYHHIKVRSPEEGYLDAIPVSGGQTVKRGDLLFQLSPMKAKDAADDEKKAGKLYAIRAPFDGMIERPPRQRGSLVRKGETLTNLFDNSEMRAYFNVPEVRYFEYKSANLDRHMDDPTIELVLANGKKFDHLGKLGAIGAVFNAGTVAFRADFPNPDGLLRHGQTGTLRLSRVQKGAIVVPQRATFEVLDKRYVYVVDDDDVAHQREISIQNESEDFFVIKKGVEPGDTIVLEGVRQVKDGDKVKDSAPERSLTSPKRSKRRITRTLAPTLQTAWTDPSEPQTSQ